MGHDKYGNKHLYSLEFEGEHTRLISSSMSRLEDIKSKIGKRGFIKILNDPHSVLIR